MIRSVVFAFAAICTFSLFSSDDPKPESQDQDVFEVRIRGFLKKRQPADSETESHTHFVESRGIRVGLDLADQSKSASLESMLNHLVEFRGELQRQADGTIMCEIKGDVRVVKHMQYLVGYESNEVDAVRKLAGELGLSVRDDYRPGKYLVITSDGKLDKSSLERLKKSSGVRYVEENQEVSIKQPSQ